MLGTIVNAAAIILGSVLGVLIKGADKLEKPIINALSLAVIVLGLSGAIGGLLDENAEPLFFILCIVIGTAIGELTDIDGKFNRFGSFLGGLAGKSGSFSRGFVTATLLYCVGAMAIVGAMESGLTNNHSILFAKSVLDGTTAIILSSMYGIGVLFSAIPVFIYQGAFTLLAGVLSPLITDDALRELSIVGSVLVAAIGFDMAGMMKIKYANMLPAVFLPILFYLPVVQNAISYIFKAFG